MFDQGKNILIGAFVLAAICLLVFLVLFLHPSPGDEDQIIHVRFSNVERIQEGTRVTFAGQPVGKVYKIIDLWNGEHPVREFDGPMYFFELVLAIDSNVKVYTTDDITIKTYGFFGDRTVAIVPKRPPPGVTPERVTADMIIYAHTEETMETAFSRLSNVSSKIGDAFDKLSTLIDTNAEEINLAVRTFQSSMAEFGTTFTDINKFEIVATLQDTLSSADAVADNIQIHLQELEEEGFWKDVGSLARDASGTAKNLYTFTDELNNGDSTIGRLLTQDDLYLDLKSIFTKADTMMNDINHYGLLFGQNRRWQRERTKRANLAAALTTPQGFRDYIECEVDQISTALTRLSVLLEEAQCSPCGFSLACNPCYCHEVANLLRRIQTLEERISLYNQHLHCNCD